MFPKKYLRNKIFQFREEKNILNQFKANVKNFKNLLIDLAIIQIIFFLFFLF